MNERFKKIMNKLKDPWVIGFILVGIVLGVVLSGKLPAIKNKTTEQNVVKKTIIWTCSMHPQIKLPKPGKCPICGMDLIPLKESSEAASETLGPRQLFLSEAAQKLAEIQTSLVERKFVKAQIRMVGKVDYDETNVGYITAYVGGRLDRLFVDYTGVPVRKGDHMVSLYSPELLATQEELFQALKAVQELQKSEVAILKETALTTLESTRERLRLWGLTIEQIKMIEERGTSSDHLTIYSPMTGIVIHKNAVEGMYVQTGTKIYTIADLSKVWVKLDAYESDLSWLRYGQEVEFYTEAYPGELFKGKISFIDPILNDQTRTVKLRVNVDNKDGKLKPGMFVRAIVNAKVAQGGKVMDASLAGLWICPMHPEVIEKEAGLCRICEMPLVKTETLGYVSPDTSAEAPLVIPASAPLVTGKRAVVYVKVSEKPIFEGREVVLGPRAGDYYLVKSGLNEGEEVVTRGNFKIDSALQIEAKPSMMNPEGGRPLPGHQHGGNTKRLSHTKEHQENHNDHSKAPLSFQKQLSQLYSEYLQLHRHLFNDQYEKTSESLVRFEEIFNSVDMKLLEGHLHEIWMEETINIEKSVHMMKEAKEIEASRIGFALLSESLSSSLKQFGVVSGIQVYRLECPMAFDGRGASWLQEDEEVKNPYFGAVMPHCGSVVETMKKEE